MEKQIPLFVRTVAERLKFKYRGPKPARRFQSFELDLSQFKLSLTDKTPCIWVQASDLEQLSPPQLADTINDAVREKGWTQSAVLVLADGDTGTLRQHLPVVLPTYLIIDGAVQKRIAKSDSPTAEFLDIAHHQVPRSLLAPYDANRYVVGSKFFGRQKEVNQVLQSRSNFLFTGIRRIGKTSLLKELQRLMDFHDPPAEGQTRRLYIDCSVIRTEEDFLRKLAYELDRMQLKLLLDRAAKSIRYQEMMFDRFASLHGRPVVIFIDELDRLLEHVGDEADLFDVLRTASNTGKARFVMAGFRLAASARANKNSPFFNMATAVNLREMSKGDVRSMVLTPMERLRVNLVDREQIAERIYRETAGLPNYIQYYCSVLLDRLDEDERDYIADEHLDEVYHDREFRGFVLDTFVDNFEKEPIERALVYALVANEGIRQMSESYGLRRMDELLRERHLKLRSSQLDRACNNLERAGVLNQAGREYEFAIPLFPRMLLEVRDVDYLFEAAVEETDEAGYLF